MSTNDNFFSPKLLENTDFNELIHNKVQKQNKLSINSLKFGNLRTGSTNHEKISHEQRSHVNRFEQSNIKTLVFSPNKQKVESDSKETNNNTIKRKLKDEFVNLNIKKIVFKSEKHKELR